MTDLIARAKLVFQSLDEFLQYYELRLVGENFTIELKVLYDIYCEQSENCLDFGTFCAILVGKDSKKTHVEITTNNPSLFRERQLAHAYQKKKANMFKKLPKIKQRHK